MVVAHELYVVCLGVALVASVPRLDKPICVVKGKIGRSTRMQSEIGLEPGAISGSGNPDITELVTLAVLPAEQTRLRIARIGQKEREPPDRVAYDVNSAKVTWPAITHEDEVGIVVEVVPAVRIQAVKPGNPAILGRLQVILEALRCS